MSLLALLDGGAAPVSADGACDDHWPYKILDGHGRHDGDGDGVGCESNPLWPGEDFGAASLTYDRDNWSYDSSRARRLLGCSSSEHVDHVVALKEAFYSGAAGWSLARKREFANDVSNMWCLDASTNISKSDHDLAEWRSGSCAERKLIARVTIDVKARYGLLTDPAERDANRAALSRDCGAASADQVSDDVETPSELVDYELGLVDVEREGRAVRVTLPRTQRPPWSAALVLSLAREHGAVAIWTWTGAVWLGYAEVGGEAAPGSTEFLVRVDDEVWFVGG